MFEKLKSYIDQGRSMLEEAFEMPVEDDFVTVPEGVTTEQLIEEAKQYVDALIVPHSRKEGTDKIKSPETNEEDNKQEV